MSPAAAARVPGRRGLAPARVIVVAFGAAVAIGTLLLLLPVASEPGVDTTAVDALFTATSAVSVTGLVVTDTATHWSAFGEVVILVLVQLGGFGIMTLSSLVALVLSRRLGLRRRLVAQTETSALNAGDVRRVVIGVAVISAVVEGVTALVLTWRFHTDTDSDLSESLWLGVFHAVTAFNNAGFALFSDNLVGFVDDWWLCIVISVAIIAGGLGLPGLRRPLRQPPTAQAVVVAHQADPRHHRRPPRRGHRADRRQRVDEPRHARCPRRPRPTARQLVRRR